ncbi:MAG: DUF4345 family protein [Chloroflexi bacterium]|nr:DUF4345 family protein [Chloroflexota bacterium]
MTLLQILQIVVALATIATGLASLLRPRAVRGFTGLTVDNPRGITEIRAVLGGTFIGLGLAPLLLNTTAAYQMLGITYLAIGLARAASMFIDKSVVQSNIISLAAEAVFVAILLL